MKTVCLVLLLCAATAIALAAQTLTTLANFNGDHGGGPNASLIQGRDGTFYGTTQVGGTNDYGTVFKISPESPTC